MTAQSDCFEMGAAKDCLLQVVSGRDVVSKLEGTPVNFFSAPKKKLKIADCGILRS